MRRATAIVASEHSICGEYGVAIIGAGCAGLCMALKLVESGRRDVVIFERGADLGGTWRDNTYPGAGCDVPSHLYSFSFAQSPEWSRTYATQPEILSYLRRVAARAGIDQLIRYDTPIDTLTWDANARLWRLTTPDGRRFNARAVVSATGMLHEPKMPDIPGLDGFSGPVFHTARWRHDVELVGRRVAVIGVGASAIQVVPAIAPAVARLTLFQRSPPWVLPRHDRPISTLARLAFRHVPGALAARRAVQYWRAEAVALGLVYKPKLLGRGQKRSARFKEREIADPALRLALNPFYTLGCKRVLLSDDFYATMTRPNVDLVTTRIAAVRPDGVVTADGTTHPCDVIVLATGFTPFGGRQAPEIRGRDGRRLADDWKDGPQGYRGVAVAGYPNYFTLVGPNSGLGHNSILFMIEAQVGYVLKCLGWIASGRLDPVEVRADVQQAYNAELARRFERTVWRDRPGTAWQLPCRSWYVDDQGRNSTLWPGMSWGYRMAMRRPRIADFLPAPCGSCLQGGGEVGAEVGDGFEADGEPDQAVGDAAGVAGGRIIGAV
ncbi:MAG: flavin-containing monooxygenase [Planctomycetota bacterium]